MVSYLVGQAESTLGAIGGLSLLGPVQSETARDMWRPLMTSGSGLDAVAHPRLGYLQISRSRCVRAVYFAAGWIPILREPWRAIIWQSISSRWRKGNQGRSCSAAGTKMTSLRGHSGPGDAVPGIDRGVPQRRMGTAQGTVANGRRVPVRDTAWRPAADRMQDARIPAAAVTTPRGPRPSIDLHNGAANLVHADRDELIAAPAIAVFALLVMMFCPPVPNFASDPPVTSVLLSR